jgi:hypothetical protein
MLTTLLTKKERNFNRSSSLRDTLQADGYGGYGNFLAGPQYHTICVKTVAKDAR